MGVGIDEAGRQGPPGEIHHLHSGRRGRRGNTLDPAAAQHHGLVGGDPAGADVKEKLNIGSREVYMDALKDGSIDLIPEYSGTLLSYLDKSSSETDPGKIVDALNAKPPIVPMGCGAA